MSYQNCGEFKANEKLDLASMSLDLPSVMVSTPPNTMGNTGDQQIPYSVSIDSRLTLRSVTCTLNGVPVTCNKDGANLTGLDDNDYVLQITATDSLGQVSTQAVSFRVDKKVPILTVSQAPANPSAPGDAEYRFTATDNRSGVNRVECSVNNATFAPCTSMTNHLLPGLTSGSYAVRIRAVDNAGNMSVVYSHSFSVQVAAPVLSLNSATLPAPFTKSRDASIAFSGTDNGQPITYFECRRISAALTESFAACTSPKTYTGLADDSYRFEVRGRDSAGAMTAAVSASWVVDNVAPVNGAISSDAGALTKMTTANINFVASDSSGIASFQCAQNLIKATGAVNIPFTTCTSPLQISGLATGAQSVSIKAIDRAGNESAVSVRNWTVDLVLPVATIVSSVSNPTTSTSATFSISASDANGIQSLECQKDLDPYTACSGSISYSGLSVGAHTFRVKAIDRAGNQTIAPYNWQINSPTPTTATVNLAWDPNSESSLVGYRIRYGTAPGSYTEMLDVGKPATVNNAVAAAVPNLATGRTYYFVVVAYDAAGESPRSNEIVAQVP